MLFFHGSQTLWPALLILEAGPPGDLMQPALVGQPGAGPGLTCAEFTVTGTVLS